MILMITQENWNLPNFLKLDLEQSTSKFLIASGRRSVELRLNFMPPVTTTKLQTC